MKEIKSLGLVLLLFGAVPQADAQSKVPFTFVAGSTKMIDCDDESTRVELGTQGPQVYCWNDGTTKAFIAFGGSTVDSGTGEFVLGGKAYTLQTRDPNSQTHVACVMASGETTTVFCGAGFGE